MISFDTTATLTCEKRVASEPQRRGSCFDEAPAHRCGLRWQDNDRGHPRSPFFDLDAEASAKLIDDLVKEHGQNWPRLPDQAGAEMPR